MSIHYAYKHTSTEATTGYFSCEPEPSLALSACFEQLANSPLDEFMHRYVLRKLMQMPLTELESLAQTYKEQPEIYTVLVALLRECALLHSDLATLENIFTQEEQQQSLGATPLPYLAWALQSDKDIHTSWAKLFAANVMAHEKLPHPEEWEDEGLVAPFTNQELPIPLVAQEYIAKVHAEYLASPSSAWARPPAMETAKRALELLVENAVLDGVEMRHEASLSPIALLRHWRMRMAVQSGRQTYTVEGQATTYGRGLSLAQARASYAMEMIERASSYASIENTAITHMSRPMPLFHGSYTQLLAEGHQVLDPNTLQLETPYLNAPLYWLEATTPKNNETILVPVQSVFLFSNLDEISLSMNPGSTGLASGNSLAEAKVAALTEIIERDAEGTMPYDRQRCFTLRSHDELVQSLLDDYAARGIHIHFLDLTTEFGIPCYQAFILTRKGQVIRATGANLNGAQAAISALTEVPYPYPHGEPSGPAIKGIPQKILEELPNYTLESPTRNLALIENVLSAHGYKPSYVDISRVDLELPVVRAIVPHLILNPELDSFSRISPRLFKNYVDMFA